MEFQSTNCVFHCKNLKCDDCNNRKINYLIEENKELKQREKELNRRISFNNRLLNNRIEQIIELKHQLKKISNPGQDIKDLPEYDDITDW